VSKEREAKLFNVFLDEQVETALLAVLRSGQLASGPNVAELARAFEAFLGFGHAVPTSDMSSAMTIALRLAGVGPGDEVITGPFACLSTNAPIKTSGAQVIWADMDAHTAALDSADVARLIGPKTKAVVLYHVCGYPGQAPELAAICRARGVALIEDCDNALGATLDGRPVGSFGDYAIYSLYPNRHLHGLEGGMLVCSDPEQALRAKRLSKFGIDATSFRTPNGEINPFSDIPEIGWSAPLSNLNAAVALAQMPGLAERLDRTRRNAGALSAQLAAIPSLRMIPPLAGADPAYWVLLARSSHRDALVDGLKLEGIHASSVHLRNDRYAGFGSRRELPGVDAFSESVLGLPCGWWLHVDDLDRISAAVARLLP
jgi:perosamine synthetase